MFTQVYIAGCGQIGRRIATRELLRGRRVRALVRGAAATDGLIELGADAEIGDLDRPETLAPQLEADTLLYYFAPPPPRGREDSRLRAFLAALGERLPERLVLISTSGVYGDCAGDWVDEERPPAPGSDRAHRRLDAECAARDWAGERGVRLVVLRVPGIYGSERLPVERLRRGLPVLREDIAPFSNRIHEEDLVEACLAAAEARSHLPVVNVTDGHPTTMTDYFNRVADHLGMPRPPQIDLDEARAQFSPGMLSYLSESRRIGNRRMIDELGVAPLYPTLAEGLAADRETAVPPLW